jgi:hypothetical protein
VFVGVFPPALWLTVSTSSASAQAISDLATYVDPSFQTTLANPADLSGALRYATGARQGVDIESAIGAYDRLLFYNPALSRVRYELGVLYYRLGSYEQARGYFQSALQMGDITPELRQPAEEFISVIERKLLPDQFGGFAQTGLRYQTNASLGPGPQALLASGRAFDSRFFAHPDWNWFGSFGVNYVHDFGTQNGDSFEATVLGYDAQQFTLHQFDLGLLEMRAGPRFGLPDTNGVSIKPYVVATGSTLANTLYSGNVGGGLTVHANVGNATLDPFVEIVQQSFLNSSFYPLASGLSGTLETYALQASGPIVSAVGWQTRLAYVHDNAVSIRTATMHSPPMSGSLGIFLCCRMVVCGP